MDIKKVKFKRIFKTGETEKTLTAYAEYDDDTNEYLEYDDHFRIRLQGELRIGDLKEWAEVRWKYEEEEGEEWKPFFFLFKDTTHPIYSEVVKKITREWEKRKNKKKKLSNGRR